MERSFLRRLTEVDVIQVTTVDGRDSDSVSCAGKCDKDKEVNFIIPEGYEKHDFTAETSYSGPGANANVYWVNPDDKRDGRIKLEANSKAFGRAVARVKEVTAIKVVD